MIRGIIRLLLIAAGLTIAGFGIYYGITTVTNHFNEFNALKEFKKAHEDTVIMDKDAFEAFKQMDSEWSQIELNVTAYYPSTKYPEGGVLNAFNRRLKPYKSCAIDPSVIPYGSLLYCPGDDRIRIADDCGSHIKGKDLDLCMATEEEMRAWKDGYRYVWVWMSNDGK